MIFPLKQSIKSIFRKFNYDIVAYDKLKHEIQIPLTLHPATSAVKGCALVSYLSLPTILSDNDERLLWHSNMWESREIVRIFNDFGFIVDVINYNDRFVPKVGYDVVFDVSTNFLKYYSLLSESTIKILHSTGADICFQNSAELARVRALEKRKNCFYCPKRLCGPTEFFYKALDLSDYCLLIGNNFTKNTHPEEYKNKIHTITVSGSHLTRIKNYDEFVPSQREFLWFFGTGAVHKGLDLVLEVFAKHPEMVLNVIGFISDEADFMQIYKHELSLPNIRVHGGLKPSSEKFWHIVKNCFCVVAPTCSEGISPAVVTCLQVGLYPIISRQTGIDLSANLGILLHDCSIDEIESAVITAFSADETFLAKQISAVQAETLKRYSRQKFTEEFTAFVKMIVDSRLNKK